MTQITAEETFELFTAHPELAVNVHHVRTLGVWLAERNLFPTPENFALAVSKLKE